jgi:hypothetical protein
VPLTSEVETIFEGFLRRFDARPHNNRMQLSSTRLGHADDPPQ